MHAAEKIAEHDALLTEVQAARVLNLSVRTLQAWRTRGNGPRFVQAGRAVRYRYDEIRSWIEANTVACTTKRATGALL